MYCFLWLVSLTKASKYVMLMFIFFQNYIYIFFILIFVHLLFQRYPYRGKLSGKTKQHFVLTLYQVADPGAPPLKQVPMPDAYTQPIKPQE